jgi:hypothetical protein
MLWPHSMSIVSQPTLRHFAPSARKSEIPMARATPSTLGQPAFFFNVGKQRAKQPEGACHKKLSLSADV